MSSFSKKRLTGSNMNEMLPNTDGSINVVVTEGGVTVPTEIQSYFNEALAVASGATQNIISFTVPPTKEFFLQRIEFGGQNVAEYEALLDGSIINRKRTWFNGNLSDQFEFATDSKDGLKLIAGQVLEVRVSNFRPDPANFEARIHGILKG